MPRKQVIAANWKMNKNIEQVYDFIEHFSLQTSSADVYISPASVHLYPLIEKADLSKIKVGAQNICFAESGAFTGDISAAMVKDLGAEFVIIGHSERRHVFGEENDRLNQKVKIALKNDLTVIYCIGEKLEQRENQETLEVLKAQLLGGLAGIKSSEFTKIIIAYEPVWAIGTGKTASAAEAEATHKDCREFIAKTWGVNIAENITIQYGGSVKPGNAAELMSQENIDGLLIGGASLEAESFLSIINNVQSSLASN